MQINDNSQVETTSQFSVKQAIELRVVQKILSQMNLHDEEKELSLREFLLIRIAGLGETCYGKNETSSILNLLNQLFSKQPLENGGACFLRNTEEETFLRTLLSFSYLHPLSIHSALSSSDFMTLEQPRSSSGKFSQCALPLLPFLGKILHNFAQFCESTSLTLKTNFQKSTKQALSVTAQTPLIKEAKGWTLHTHAKSSDAGMHMLQMSQQFRIASKKMVQRTQRIEQLAKMAHNNDFKWTILLLLSISNSRAAMFDLHNPLISMATAAGNISALLRTKTLSAHDQLLHTLDVDFLKELLSTSKNHIIQLNSFVQSLLTFSLEYASSPVEDETKLSSTSLWIEAVDVPITDEQTPQAASKNSSSKQKKRNKKDQHTTTSSSYDTAHKRTPPPEPEKEVLLALSPSQQAIESSLPVYEKLISTEIQTWIQRISSSPCVEESTYSSDNIYTTLTKNFQYHASQLFLAIDWIATFAKNPALHPYALSQFSFFLANLIEVTVCLRYHAAFESLPTVHCLENSLRELSLLPSLSKEERNFIKTINRMILWQRYPFFAKENYSNSIPSGLKTSLQAAGEDDNDASPFPAMAILKQECLLTFSIIRKIIQWTNSDMPLAFSSLLFDRVQITARSAISLPVELQIDPLFRSIEENLSSSNTHITHRQEIRGQLHRLKTTLKIYYKIGDNDKYSAMILQGLAILPLAVESTLRLITVEKTGVLSYSHDFNECFTELGKDCESFCQETHPYKLGRGYYLPASYPSIPFANAMVESAKNSISHLGIEEGFSTQKNKNGSLVGWIEWAEKGVSLIDRLLTTLKKS